MATQQAADLALKNGVPGLIVASVRNYSSEDFIPEKIDGHPDSGGAGGFIAFFKDELLPGLDSRFLHSPLQDILFGFVRRRLRRPYVFIGAGRLQWLYLGDAGHRL